MKLALNLRSELATRISLWLRIKFNILVSTNKPMCLKVQGMNSNSGARLSETLLK